jgi:hypothetical protein
MAIGLYTKGTYRKNDRTLSAPAFLKNETSRVLSASMFVVLGSIANDNNKVLGYNPNTDGSGLASFLWPDYIKPFLQKMAGINVQWISQATSNSLEMLDYSKYYAIAMVNSGYLTGGVKSKGVGPDHYVVVTNFQYNSCVDRACFDLTYWNWGWEDPQTVNKTTQQVNKLLYSIWVITK